MTLFDNPSWIINEPLHGQKLMVIVMLFEIAGMSVIDDIYRLSLKFPYIAKSEAPKYCIVSARTKIIEQNYQISYNEAIDELTKIIKGNEQ